MRLIGLTGSIGMGKSTTLRMFAEAGAATWDADQAVHALYRAGQSGAEAVRTLFPAAVGPNGVDRGVLAAWLSGHPDRLAELEAAVHPLVADHRREAIEAARAKGAGLMVLDIPLLFETGGEAAVDAVVVVSASPEIQAERVLARPGMTREKMAMVLARQAPDAEKRTRADFVIDTGLGLDHARAEVQRVVDEVSKPDWRRIPKAAETRH
ncbi:dephospho-CoA kinase [Brevundimonas lutea]|uniref:dephospho-CoA kinase n=1 Tax=Brevundimonas lutea TaxID=2293980 RepID=UPI000F0187A2|nr:dephospho-CoA kinase [Brevundimonas lutea]